MKTRKGRENKYYRLLAGRMAADLIKHKKLITTKSKAARVSPIAERKYGGVVRSYRLKNRTGDGADMVMLVWKETIHENKSNKTK